MQNCRFYTVYRPKNPKTPLFQSCKFADIYNGACPSVGDRLSEVYFLDGKVVYPIGVKLNIVITLLLIFSLGSITALVAVFVRSDVEQTARNNNKNINTMSAIITEANIGAIRGGALIFLKRLETETAAFSEERRQLWAGRAAAYFFSQEPSVAGVVAHDGIVGSAGGGYARYINTDFMKKNLEDEGKLDEYIQSNPVAVSRARMGETVLMNAAPYFNGTQILALSFPQQVQDSQLMPVTVFFSPQELIDTFGTGAHSSFLTNDAGDALIHHNQDLIAGGANLLDNAFVRDCWNGTENIIQAEFAGDGGVKFLGDFARLENFGNIGVFTTIQSNVVVEGANTATRRNIELSVMVAFLSVLFIWFFSKSFSRPLEELTGAVRQIEGGFYQIHLENKNADETGELTRNVLSMSYAIRNFEKFTNKTIARLSLEGSLKAEGMNKDATLFFSDIRSFTAISEKMRAEDVVDFLNEYMERMVSCIIATGGVIDKFIGDAVMAHWGPVETAGDPASDALNGVRSALMMRANLMNFNAKRRGDEKEPKIKIGCGLNTGKVMAGQIGSAERVVYTVIGEAVSFADRTETFNKPFGTEILITEHTWKLVHEHFICEEMPSVTERGETVKIFAVINTAAEEESENLLKILDSMPFNDVELNRKCVGPAGPQTLAELRTLLGIPTPDLSKLNLDEEEKKYSLASDKNQGSGVGGRGSGAQSTISDFGFQIPESGAVSRPAAAAANGGAAQRTAAASGNGGAGQRAAAASGNGGAGQQAAAASGNGGAGQRVAAASGNGGAGLRTAAAAAYGGAAQRTAAASGNGGAGQRAAAASGNG
ncbi:MAG: adenylate/guanylate cyclase domain-containing protein, partial [Spirochaetaceae bacterium]|nr:adenylate/guanylate cyclase domain-containing protein [Spirochaetaceae bacterium]